jgi:multidrug efflux pump subunit AcrA (membrane-fusion protein)
VYLLQDSTVTLRPVTLGTAYGDKVEVLSGLTDKDKVVITGQLNLSEGAKVEVVRVVE